MFAQALIFFTQSIVAARDFLFFIIDVRKWILANSEMIHG